MLRNPALRIARALRAVLARRANPAPGSGSHGREDPLAPRSLPERRALELLRSALSPAQLACLEAHGYFRVETPQARRLCILPFAAFNVLDVESGESFCAGPQKAIPLADLMLAQKLVLETEPRQFFAVANRRLELDPKRVPEAQRPEAVIRSRMAHASKSRIRCMDVAGLP